jgi:hypothetical protein
MPQFIRTVAMEFYGSDLHEAVPNRDVMENPWTDALGTAHHHVEFEGKKGSGGRNRAEMARPLPVI